MGHDLKIADANNRKLRRYADTLRLRFQQQAECNDVVVIDTRANDPAPGRTGRRDGGEVDGLPDQTFDPREDRRGEG